MKQTCNACGEIFAVTTRVCPHCLLMEQEKRELREGLPVRTIEELDDYLASSRDIGCKPEPPPNRITRGCQDSPWKTIRDFLIVIILLFFTLGTMLYFSG